MKDNYFLHIVGTTVELVPYRKKYVTNYHEWMKDPYILEMTASEPLTIEEEYEMQLSWRDDPKKCTFIVLKRESFEEKSDSKLRMIGDVNLFLNKDENDQLIAEIDIMIAENTARKRGFGFETAKLMMAYGLKLGVTKFIAKINASNQPSIKLFEKLGYKLIQFVECFQEYEYQYSVNEDSISVITSVWDQAIIEDFPEDEEEA